MIIIHINLANFILVSQKMRPVLSRDDGHFIRQIKNLNFELAVNN